MKIQCLSFFLLLCLLLTGCTEENINRFLIADVENSEEYTAILNTYLSGYGIREQKDTLYAEVTKGNAVACFDVQAIPAVEQGVGRYWYPHVLATLVIAVDRAQTDIAVTGWNSLWESGVPVGISSESVIRNMMVLGAISYGLNNETPTKEDALILLEYIRKNATFKLGDANAPIILCLDYEAVACNRNGGNYEIVVPKEGTLSYTMGLLSDVPLTTEVGLGEALLSAGFPLADGHRPQDFPEDYESAHMLALEDYNWFLDVTGDSSRDLRRQVFHTRLYTTADLREHILSALLVVAVILLWKGTVSHRMIRRDVCQAVTVMSGAMAGWILLRLLKYQLPSEWILCRLCWYGYYVFQLALPVVLLYLAVILGRTEGEVQLLHSLWFPCVIYVFSVLLVMTNDLHQLVFRFESGGNWSNDYSYGFGYWSVMFFFLIFLLLAIGKFFYGGWRSGHWGGKIFSLLVCAGGCSYILAYIYRVPLAWESDLTVCICIIFILFFETLLHTGLIPVNIQYQRLFACAPIGLTLLDENGRMVLSSLGAPPVSHSIWKRLFTDMKHPLLRDNDTQLHAVPIHGGMVVWQENLSALNKIWKEIQDVQIRLEAANALLREEGEVKKRLLTVEANRSLFEHLDHDMECRMTSLINLIETLPETENRRALTAYITLCLCHIKRRCNLFFLARQGDPLLGTELGIYLDELAELARYAGLQILIRCGQSGALEIGRAALCYDFAFETISWALRENASPVMGYLEQEDDYLIFRFLPGGDPAQWRFTEELMMALSALGGQIVCKDLDDAVGICMNVPLGGETCV